MNHVIRFISYELFHYMMNMSYSAYVWKRALCKRAKVFPKPWSESSLCCKADTFTGLESYSVSQNQCDRSCILRPGLFALNAFLTGPKESRWLFGGMSKLLIRLFRITFVFGSLILENMLPIGSIPLQRLYQILSLYSTSMNYDVIWWCERVMDHDSWLS